MKFAVLGSNSFTGSHFVNFLLEQELGEVIGISRSAEYPDVLCPYKYKKTAQYSRRFQFHRLCVNRDLNAVLALLDQFKPEVIVNFAAQGEVRSSWNFPEQWFETNTMSVVRLTSELVKRDYLRKYVAASTPEVYGSTGLNVSESNCYEPSTPYAASKLAGDLHLLTLFKRHGFPVCLTRAANLYGIHQQLYRIIPRTVIYAKLGKKLELHGGGRARRAFIHARDVAQATHLIAVDGKPGQVYHLTPENELHSIADVVGRVCTAGNFDFNELTKMVQENFGQDEVFSMTGQKMARDLDWIPRISFADGIAETVKWIHDEWQVIQKLPHDYVHQI